jgi:hypothetical protein
LALGLIDAKQFAEIEATNTILKRQLGEHNEAVKNKRDVTELQKMHKRELEEADTRQIATGLRAMKI